MKPTADTITDEQIHALWRDACGPGPHHSADADTMHLCTVAINHHGDFTAKEQDAARARCAEILNQRQGAEVMRTPDKPWEVWITDPDGTKRMNARFDGVERALIELDWYRKRGITAHMRYVESK